MTARALFAGMSDRAVVERAADHLRKAAALEHGSPPSKREWFMFRLAMMELDRRQMEARGQAAVRQLPSGITWRDPPANAPGA